MPHLHSIYDTDLHFLINPITRAIKNESTKKTTLMQYDHNSERFTFEMPRYIEGHDMSLCNKIEVHYINIGTNKTDKSEGVYPVVDVQISNEDENVVIFSWLISGKATMYAGSLNFLIGFMCLTGDVIGYSWHTKIFKDITIGEGMNNGEAVVTEYSDVLETWKSEIFAEFEINFDREREAAQRAIEETGAAVLASIPEDYTALNAKVEEHTVEIAEAEKERATLDSRSMRQDKLIKNLLQAVQNCVDGITPAPYDNTPAYARDIPENALPYAEVTKIGGMTRKCTNLIPYPYLSGGVGSTYTSNGITYTVNSDHSITGNGTATNVSFFIIASKINVPSGTYFISDRANMGDSAYCRSGNGIHNTAITIDGTPIDIELRVASGVTLNNVTFYPMLNIGSTALPYEPYFEGLRSAPVSELVSEGVNIWNEEWYNASLNENTGAFTEASTADVSSKNYISVLPNTQYYNSMDCWIAFYDKNKAFISASSFSVGGFTTPSNCYFMKFQTLGGKYGLVYKNDIIIAKGSTAMPYRPYFKRTLPIPEAVRPAHGINETVYDYIEWCEDGTRKKRVKCGAVDIGTLNWVYGSGVFFVELDKKYGFANLLCGAYPNDPVYWQDTSNKSMTGSYTSSYVYVKDSAYTDVATFKAAMSGVMLLYELAEPEVTDISDILPEDNMIGVQAGGKMTAENESKYAVPITIK